MARRILITGASGFIGRHVARAALARQDLAVRLVTHTGTPDGHPPHRAEHVRADLREISSLRGLCRGVDTVVHCASLITGDDASLEAVNDRGTRALVADAQRHGIRRVVYVSTAAVYGPGPFRRAGAQALAVRPHSATSRTRAAAERHVLEAGGTVLRPHLVYGTGDTWVIPGLALLLGHLGAAVETNTLHSAVEADALARAALAAALADTDLAGAHHVNHPRPVHATDLMAAALTHLALPARRPLSTTQAAARLTQTPRAAHHLGMLTTDHWFDSEPIWQLLNLDTGPDPLTGLARHAPWYEQQLRSHPRPRPLPGTGTGTGTGR
ncbi:NAD-dependent epimerase/dehydratase family protein [Streptomyces brasiliensis]|uniref:NAD-dependent epimerase/dehydratase domain-containing protein n=1 Tax=Streptomyces brasiliensis TaxID=1954 RepID=A0A917L6I8_9ACTN|nr:NAD-dependent epimerase/dehydratase family protein [Streptomyces brasiliensis]GGJ44484.1 hypothetical protein GCM10010121_064590 [Streptomyces brasiliensis]